MVMDYKLVNRSFYLQVPQDLGQRAAPVLIGLHAQGFQADSSWGSRCIAVEVDSSSCLR